jgi:uncharacterized protein
MLSQELIAEIRQGFAMSLDGIHGEAHWARVLENGLRLAAQTGADVEIVALFAYLHDSKRQSDGWDRGHGLRAAAYVRALPEALLPISPGKRRVLAYAIAHHSDGLTEAGATVQTCWDADRLDLGRIGIRPDPARICTAAARDPETIGWAYRRSRLRQSA